MVDSLQSGEETCRSGNVQDGIFHRRPGDALVSQLVDFAQGDAGGAIDAAQNGSVVAGR